MAIKKIEYKVNIAGITPATEQFGGTQGDHKVTTIEFVTDDLLNDKITDFANEIHGKAMYRFDVYDGEGGIWSSEPKELEYYTLSMELDERHTRHGGKVTIYLVLTVLSPDCETEIELYSFPAVLRLKNRPEGTHQDGESYESVTSLVESAKSNALAAEKSNKELQAFAAQIEEKLKNGEFDGVSVTHSFDGTILKMTSASGTTEVDLKGDKGEKGTDGKDAVTDQTYNAESENAQSGKAVAEAIKDNNALLDLKFAEKPRYDPDQDIVFVFDTSGKTITPFLENNRYFEHGIEINGSVYECYGDIPRRQLNGNLMTNAPIKDLDCANKKYVDDAMANAGGGSGVEECLYANVSGFEYFRAYRQGNVIYIKGQWSIWGNSFSEIRFTAIDENGSELNSGIFPIPLPDVIYAVVEDTTTRAVVPLLKGGVGNSYSTTNPFIGDGDNATYINVYIDQTYIVN